MSLIDNRKIVLCLEQPNKAENLSKLFLNDFEFFTYRDSTISSTLTFIEKAINLRGEFEIDLIILDNPEHIPAIRSLTQKIPIVVLSNNEISANVLANGNIFCFKYTSDKEDWKNIFTYLWDKDNRRAVIPYLQQLQILDLN